MINKLRQHNAYCTDEHSLEHATINNDPSLTEGSHAPQLDINYIIERAARGYTENTIPAIPPEYGDFTGINDFQTAMHQVRHAQNQFMSLPAELRREFDNDAGQLLDFLANPANRERAIELGLIERPEPQALVPASVLGS